MLRMILLFIAISTLASSCGMLLRDKSFRYQYDRLPSEPVQADAHSYSLYLLDKLGAGKLGFTRENINENYVDFKKYQYKTERGDLLVLFHFLQEQMKVDTIAYKASANDKNVAAGSELFKYQFNLETKIDYSILDGHRNLITTNTETFKSTKVFDGGNSKSDLAKKWSEAKNTKMNEWLKESVERNLNAIKLKIRDKYDQRLATTSINAYTIRNAEKERLNDMDNAFNIFENALSYTTIPGNEERMYDKLEEARVLWKKIMKKQRLNNKDQQKVYFACAKNIANTFFIEQNYDSTLFYIDLATKADYKSGELRRFRDEVSERLLRIEKNRNTNFVYQGKYNEKEALKSEYLNSLIQSTFQGDRLTTRFGESFSGNVEYVFDQGNYISVSQIKITDRNTNRIRTFRPDDIEFIFQGNKKFRIFEISPVKMLKVWLPSELILETNYAGLYKNTDGEDFILTKKSLDKEEAVATFHVDFTDINRGIKLFYNDCVLIRENADKGFYSKTESSLSKLVLSYTECKL